MIWRERRVLLIILSVLLLANAVFFFTYRVQYQRRLDALDEQLAQNEAQVDRARNARLKAERTYQAYRQIEHDVQQVFDEHWSTQHARLTALIGEVKRLAIASNLVPKSYSFGQMAAAAPGAAATSRRSQPIGVTEVGITFEVAGTYEQVRRLINLLELSRQFVIVDQIALGAREGNALTLRLHLKTLFRDEENPVAGNRL